VTTYTFPAVTPQSSSWGLESNTAVFGDPLKGTAQTLARPGAKWVATLTFNALDADDRATLQAFLVQLRGQENRASLYDHSHTQRGALGGTPLVNGASQTGTSLITDGWPNTTTVLKAGDRFTVNGELKMVTSDVTSDGAGNATISFEPALRASPANDAPITTSNPTATFMLSGPRVQWSNRPADFSGFTIEFIEDIA
jgi:hypothetical protein